MAFVSLLLYLGCVYIRPQEWIQPLIGAPLMNGTAISTIILFLLDKPKRLVRAPQNMFMVWFLAALVVSHLSHFYFGGAEKAFFDFVKIVIMYFLVINIVNSASRFKTTVNVLVVFTVLLALQGIMQYRTGYGLAGQALCQQGAVNRITWIGIFNDPNDLALAFVICIPFVLNHIFNARWSWKLLSIGSLGVLLYALFLTNSRGGILAFLVVLDVHFMRYFHSKKAAFVGIILSVVLGILLLRFGPSRMSNISAGEDSAYGRIEAWYEGARMLRKAPLFGVGYNMFQDYHYLTAHNSIVLCVAETGLVGYFLWVGLFYFSFKYLRSVQKACGESVSLKELAAEASALEISIIGFIAAAFFLSRTYIILPYILIALSVALFHICQQGKGIGAGTFAVTRSADIRNIILIAAASLSVAYGVVKLSL